MVPNHPKLASRPQHHLQSRGRAKAVRVDHDTGQESLRALRTPERGNGAASQMAAGNDGY
jgi:hypothetical protein